MTTSFDPFELLTSIGWKAGSGIGLIFGVRSWTGIVALMASQVKKIGLKWVGHLWLKWVAGAVMA